MLVGYYQNVKRGDRVDVEEGSDQIVLIYRPAGIYLGDDLAEDTVWVHVSTWQSRLPGLSQLTL